MVTRRGRIVAYIATASLLSGVFVYGVDILSWSLGTALGVMP